MSNSYLFQCRCTLFVKCVCYKSPCCWHGVNGY